MSSERGKFEEVEISSRFGIRGPWKSFTEVDAEPDPGVTADASSTAMSSAEPVTRDPGSLTLSTDLGRGESLDQQPPKSQGDASPPDFVDTYRRYADVYEMPVEVHEAMALALLAAAANGNVWIELGDKRLPLDSWFLITTGSGGGRNTAIKKAREILQASKLEGVLRNISWGSEPIVKQHFAENPHGLYIWSEMSEKLQDLGRPQFAGVKPWITDLYDETTPPATKIYRKIPDREGTPPIEFKVAPRTTFVATSSFEWLMQNLTRVDSTGGFLARWMQLHVTQKNKTIPIPRPSDKNLIPALAKRLRQVAELEGTADLSAVKEMYIQWYEDTAKRFERQPNQEIAQAYWNRHRDHLLKLAVLFEMSRTGTLKISVLSVKRAITYAARIEASLFEIFPTGFEREGYEQARMLQYVGRTAAQGTHWSDFTREFKNMDAGQRVKRLRTLIEGKDLYRFYRTTTGRPAWILVHRDYVDEYTRQHPDDPEAPWEEAPTQTFFPSGGAPNNAVQTGALALADVSKGKEGKK
jgi:hypothetical protein